MDGTKGGHLPEHEGRIEVVEVILIEICDLSEHARNGTKPPRAKSYRIVVDGRQHTVHQHEMTGAQILGLVGKAPDRWALQEKLHGGKRVRIAPDQVVEFAHHGVERFETSPKRVTNGEAGPRGPLTEDDAQFLDGLGYEWQIVAEAGAWAVVLRNYSLPAGYQPPTVDLMVRMPAQYPFAPLDMFNVHPPVRRADGRPLANLTTFQFQGAVWQQWSRHREPHMPWVPGLDSLATHMAIVEASLAADLA